MNVVLVCLNRFQEYLLINLDHLLKLGEKKIYVITQKEMASRFSKYGSKINLVFVEELGNTFDFENKSKLNKEYRDEFWIVTSSRFFYIYEWMRKYRIQDVMHIENDNLNYYKSEVLKGRVEKTKLYLPFNNFKISIASLMYIPNAEILAKLLVDYAPNKSDTRNFAQLREKFPELIGSFPIFPDFNVQNQEERWVTENFKKFHYIFDGNAIGQFLGGIDEEIICNPKLKWIAFFKQFLHLNLGWNNAKKILSGHTRGYINENVSIRYDQYPIYFREVEEIRKPFLLCQNQEIPIFNLHIHSKRLQEFV